MDALTAFQKFDDVKHKPNQSVASYFAEIYAHGTNLFPLQTDKRVRDAVCLGAFVANLRNPIKLMVMRNGPSSLENALFQALAEERKFAKNYLTNTNTHPRLPQNNEVIIERLYHISSIENDSEN